MAIDCSPESLIVEAKCFDCLNRTQRDWIKTYLLALIAGTSTDPAVLIELSKCFSCLSAKQLKQVQAYLMCLVAGGAIGGYDWGVDWTPDTIQLELLLGLRTGGIGCLTNVTSISIRHTTNEGGYYISDADELLTLTLDNLTSVSAGDIDIRNCNALTAISLPLLASCPTISFQNNLALTELDLPLLTTVSAFITISGNTLMTSVSMPLLTNIVNNLAMHNNTSLADVDLSSCIPANGKNMVFSGGALTVTSVNHILARCVANAAYISGTVDTSGGTSAAPAGQGILDKATLIARGCTVNTN